MPNKKKSGGSRKKSSDGVPTSKKTVPHRGVSKWKLVEDQLAEIHKLAKYGLTDEQISDVIGIHRDTFIEYKKAHPELVAYLNGGKVSFDIQVVDSLQKKLLGFEYVEEHIEYEPVTKAKKKGQLIDDKGNLKDDVELETKPKISKIKRVKKYYAPDTMAIIYWLNNRMKQQFKMYHNDKKGSELEDEEVEALRERARELMRGMF